MKLQQNYSLKGHNTLNVDASAHYFVLVESPADIRGAIGLLPDFKKIFILGGGSNVVFTADFDGLVLKDAIRGIRIIRSSEEYAWIECHGGEEWQELVEFSLENDLSGIENLSSIPGSVGASPVQNIGAYGVEIKDVLESVEAVNIGTGEVRSFTNNECRFGYRDSIFKHELRSSYFVTKIVIKLAKRHAYTIEYGDIKKKLLEYAGQPLSVKLLSRVIAEIRASKLPDPKEIGNCGSFFKNSIVALETFQRLRSTYPDIPGYPEQTGEIKIPSGWLIEQCGWKGWRKGDAAVYPKHSLILVNYGNATGREIYELSEWIIASVSDKFGIVLDREAQIV